MASISAISPLRARLALRASRLAEEAFVCRRCLHQQQKTFQTGSDQKHLSTKQTDFLNAFRRPGHYRIQSTRSNSSASISSEASPLGALGRTIGNKIPTSATSNTASKSSSFPSTSSKSVAYWLLASATSVFGIVVFGGLTRLTESGLSITEWRPVTGSLPPMNQEKWEEEFALYKASPEFKMLNSRMGLEEFKKIYWMEWVHRLWGRVVGITILLPTIYFVARKQVSKPMAFKLVGICGLIGTQGLIGWWMVKSGLKDELLETGSQPRVSQYRLATHLGTAFVAYIAMLWNGLSILRAHALLSNPAEGLNRLAILRNPALAPFRRLLAGLSILTFTTVISGAFVAGLDAGLVYPDFPWMGHPNFFPPKGELLDPHYSHTPAPHSDLLWRNMLENPVTAQLDHRILATTTFTAIIALWTYTRFSPRVRAILPSDARKGMLGVVHLVSLQVALGISTLWYLVPTPLASAHQAGALALLTGVFMLGNRVWVPSRTIKLVQKAAERASSRAGQRQAQSPLTTSALR